MNELNTQDLISIEAEALPLAEDWFGPRQSGFDSLPPAFGGKSPYLVVREGQPLQILVNEGGRREPMLAAFDIAHECVHRLSPVAFGKATVLEEGLATWFQFWFVQ